MINLSIVIPCFNEAKSLPKLVKDFSKKLKRRDVELILVNNGSNDLSETILLNLKKNYNFLKTIRLKKNNGYGNGILQGLKKAKGQYLSWTHADLQTDPYDAITGFEKFKKELSPKIFIKGNRLDRPLKDVIFTVGMSIFETILLKKFFWDVNAQPNIFHKNFFNILERIPLDFSFDLFFYFNAKKKNLKILRFPVNYTKRKFGVSHWNTDFKNKMKFIKRTIKYSFQLKKEL